MTSWLLRMRLTRIGKRPLADKTVKASIHERLVQAGYLHRPSSLVRYVRIGLATSTVLIMGLSGMASYAYASDAVLPDTPLYPVRQTIEKIQQHLATSEAEKTKIVKEQGLRRTHEAHILLAQHKRLPALHAKILEEEKDLRDLREEMHERRAEHETTSTQMIALPQLTTSTRMLLAPRKDSSRSLHIQIKKQRNEDRQHKKKNKNKNNNPDRTRKTRLHTIPVALPQLPL